MLTWGPATPANNIIFPPDASQREMQNAGPKNGPGMTTLLSAIAECSI